MRLAFVIPAYNEEVLIGHCLEAVLREIKRAGCEAEVVVVNNASTDDTKAVAMAFPGVKVVDEPSKGIVHARHRGLQVTTAELVANIDADTIMPAGWIDTVFNEFSRDAHLVALSGPVIYYDLPWWQRFLVQCAYVAAYPFYLFIHDVTKAGSMVQGGNFVFRRSAWEAAGGYDRSIRFYGEDTDVGRRLRRLGRVKWTFALPMPASGRRVSSEGMLATGGRYLLNYLCVILRGKPFSRTYTDVRPSAPQS